MVRPFQLIACAVGQHRRDHRRVRRSTIDGVDYYVSTCRACRMPMIKDQSKWRVMSGAERTALQRAA